MDYATFMKSTPLILGLCISSLVATEPSAQNVSVPPGAAPDKVATSLMPVPIYPFAVHAVAFSPGGELLATGNGEGLLRLWRTNGELARTIRAHSNWTFSVVWMPDGHSLLTGGGDDLIRHLDLTGDSSSYVLAGHANDVHGLVVSRDGRWLLSGGDDRKALLWDLREGRVVQTLAGHERQVTSVALNPDGQLAATGSRDHTIRLWKLPSGELVDTLIGHAADVLSVKFSPDGQRLASASYDGTVRVWDVQRGRTERVFTEFLRPTQVLNTMRVFQAAYSPDGALLAATGSSSVRIWRVESGQQLHAVTPGASIQNDQQTWTENLSSVAFSPDGRTLAAGSTSGKVYFISVEQGEVLRELTPPSP
jgi:WD40 repeat protein